MLPYFMKLEKNLVKTNAPFMRGKHGPITVSEVPWKSKSAKHFVAAAKDLGIPYVDYNGASQVGVAYLQTSTKNGARVSSNVGYLYPFKHRKNLFIRKMSQVTRILIDPSTKVAYGVEYSKNGVRREVYASKEVILSAGAINRYDTFVYSRTRGCSQSKIVIYHDLFMCFGVLFFRIFPVHNC